MTSEFIRGHLCLSLSSGSSCGAISVYFAGGVSTDKSGSAKLSDAFLVVQGLDKAPKQLTIKRIMVNHLYKDADWSFVIPQNGTKGVIPE